ncbi:hypothetical protein O3P69_007270 [Scylla paramamosain]|uniref:Uncharacterized protein n=1 Tax=Scylla paramamosain TaxID=85552 RepID=A0AAW0V518_SCYPA
MCLTFKLRREVVPFIASAAPVECFETGTLLHNALDRLAGVHKGQVVHLYALHLLSIYVRRIRLRCRRSPHSDATGDTGSGRNNGGMFKNWEKSVFALLCKMSSCQRRLRLPSVSGKLPPARRGKEAATDATTHSAHALRQPGRGLRCGTLRTGAGNTREGPGRRSRGSVTRRQPARHIHIC